MKEPNKNEIDLLLRSMARQRGVSSASQATGAGNGGRSISDHLDADELNSYAEGVLLPAARARYSQHLADCDDCRGLVVSLSQASGALNRPTVSEKVGTTFWQKVAALFSMPVMKFAVPALMLTVVIGVGLFAFRQQQNRSEVAQLPLSNTEQTPKVVFDERSNAVDNQANHSATPANSPNDQLRGGVIAGNTKVIEETETLKRAESDGDKVVPLKDAPAKEAGAGLPGSYAAEPKAAAAPAPPPAPSTTMGELAKSDDSERDSRVAKREDQNQNRSQYQFKTAPNDERGPSRGAQQNTVTVQSAESQAGARVRGPSGLDKGKKANEVESRSVAGRRFVREGDAWVDSAYDSSKATIRVARGSEQFRALIADEPQIRNIADQLGGVVIVVWKGKAYRIQ